MLKGFLRWFVVVVAVVAGLWLAKNLIAKVLVVRGVKAITGVNLKMDSFGVGILNTRVDIQGLKVQNPPGFHDPTLAEFPEVYVDYDLGSFLKGKVHLEDVRVHLRELIVIRNEQGVVNVNSLQMVKAAQTQKAPSTKPAAQPSAFQIDRLQLRIDNVIYKDYTQTPPVVNEYRINANEQFANVNNPYVLGGLILTRALAKTAVARLANINLGSLQADVSVLANSAVGLAEHVGTQAVGTAEHAVKDTLKKLLPFGQGQPQKEAQ